MTTRQAAVLKWLRRWFASHLEAPSYQDIADGLGFRSKSQAYLAVDDLVRDGYVEREAGRARSIRLTAHGRGDDPLQAALRRLFDAGLIEEDEASGHAVVSMDALGALELAWRGDRIMEGA